MSHERSAALCTEDLIRKGDGTPERVLVSIVCNLIRCYSSSTVAGGLEVMS